MMAEGGTTTRQKSVAPAKINLVCRYYIHGVCSKGSDCIYLHDKSRSLPMDNICRYYQHGMCSYGQKCRYDHVKKDGKKDTGAQNQIAQTPTPRSTPDTRQSRMVTLTKKGINHSITESEKKKELEEKWVQAKAFVPGQRYHGSAPSSYADAIGGDSGISSDSASTLHASQQNPVGDYREYEENAWGGEGFNSYVTNLEPTGIGGLPAEAITEETPLCPYYAVGECPYDSECTYAHGDICDMCGMPCLHPVNKEQREEHVKECVAEHEKEMELAFALQASEGRECGICLEDVLNKEGPKSDHRFGILENCNHCFCLTCIRQWRGNKEVSIETHRSCPTCRIHSDFITPSKYWVTTSEEKTKLIQEYKKALRAKPCQYFKKGKGECPFNTKCFYLHALEDGSKVEANLVKRRWRTNAEGEHAIADAELSLWDFINSRDTAGSQDLDLDEEISLLLMEIFQASSDDNSDVDSWVGDVDSDAS